MSLLTACNQFCCGFVKAVSELLEVSQILQRQVLRLVQTGHNRQKKRKVTRHLPLK